MQAMWNGVVLAESDQTIEIEGNQYFPPESINRALFKESDKHTTCPWKGEASYLSVVVEGAENTDAAWYYPEPKEAAKEIAGHFAFWRGITVTD